MKTSRLWEVGYEAESNEGDIATRIFVMPFENEVTVEQAMNYLYATLTHVGYQNVYFYAFNRL